MTLLSALGSAPAVSSNWTSSGDWASIALMRDIGSGWRNINNTAREHMYTHNTIFAINLQVV